MQKWLDDAVFYEIYPPSFYDSNGDGIGDLEGVIRKLDYIKNLGFNGIWLNPCWESPFMDGGYDVTDYYKVDPRYGDNETLKRLIDKAHSLGIKVLLDLVPGHTSDKHPWFLESRKTEKNPYSDYYIWTQNAWQDGGKSSFISGMQDRDGKYMVNFFSHQPALNYGYAKCEHPWQQPVTAEGPMAVRNELKKMIKFWLDFGADGFRVDMAFSLVKNDEDGAEGRKLWGEVRRMMDKEYPDRVILAEWGCPEKAVPAGFHMDFYLQFHKSGFADLFHDIVDINENLPFDKSQRFFKQNGEGNAARFAEEYAGILKEIEGKGYACMPSGNHDVLRLAYKKDAQMLKLCFTLLLTMPGVPFVYYGDEIGMDFTKGLSKEGGYRSRTGSRTPMQWNNGVNMGFSTAASDKIYLPVGASPVNAEEQAADPDSLLNNVAKLVNLRKNTPQLHAGAPIEFLYAKPYKCPLVYSRGGGVIVALNPSDKPVTCKLKASLAAAEILYSVGGKPEINDKTLSMPPVSSVIIKY